MAKKQITTRKDGVTKDMQATDDRGVRDYHYPSLGVTVQAKSYAEALQKAKAQFSSKQ